MADVAARTVGLRRGGRRDDGGSTARPAERGQLILVTSLSLAILFVTLALILNTAIYTENLATRSSDIGGGTDAVRYHDAARDGVGGVVDYVNAHNNSSYETLATNLSTGVADFRDESARQFAISDRAVETNLVSTQNGTRIAQTDDSRDFANASGTTYDWTVVEDVSNTRAFRMLVFPGLLAPLNTGSPFKVVLDDGTQQWNMTVSSSVPGQVKVTVDGPTASGSCDTVPGPAWINVTDGTVAGEPCQVLESFGDGLTSSYDVRFANASNVEGTYAMVVDNDTLAGSPGPHLNSPGSGQPFAAHAVYSATVDVAYQSPRLYYNATVRVAPGEPA